MRQLARRPLPHGHTPHRYRGQLPCTGCTDLPWLLGRPALSLLDAGCASARALTLSRMAYGSRAEPRACHPVRRKSKRDGRGRSPPRQTTRFADKPRAAQCTPTPDAHESQRYYGLLLTNPIRTELLATSSPLSSCFPCRPKLVGLASRCLCQCSAPRSSFRFSMPNLAKICWSRCSVNVVL